MSWEQLRRASSILPRQAFFYSHPRKGIHKMDGLVQLWSIPFSSGTICIQTFRKAVGLILFNRYVTFEERRTEHANTLSRMPSTHSRTFRLFRERSRGLFTIYDRVRHMPLPLFNTSRTLRRDILLILHLVRMPLTLAGQASSSSIDSKSKSWIKFF